jgi:menaquinone-9 beta-reductase
MMANPDAVVLGGGPAGATAALLLARAGWRVALIEKKAFPRRKVCGEYISATTLPLLDGLGLGETFCAAAGPEVRSVGLFAGPTTLQAALPRLGGQTWGRALGRESLDTMLLQVAAAAGVALLQPYTVVALTRHADEHRVRVASRTSAPEFEFQSNVVIAAHGSWDAGTLPTQPQRRPPRADDLLGFKAHFANSDLPQGLMPLLGFPGGYGGMVHCDGGRVSLSCCIRRDWLATLQRKPPGEAGEAVLAHILESCAGVRQALRGATRQGSWLSAGPIRPGIRTRERGGLFRVGNAAGEAHPAVAEGISMAMQSSWLLAERLTEWKRHSGDCRHLDRVNAAYSRDWQRHFAPRLRASSVIAHWAMRKNAVRAVLPMLHCFPGLLNWGARFSGKARRVVRAG